MDGVSRHLDIMLRKRAPPVPDMPNGREWCKISGSDPLCFAQLPHTMANNSVILEIKDRLDVVTVVGRYVPLKKSGNSYVGLCPFHSEKTPSFHVFPSTNTWKCFGCGAGGDIFTFVEKKENLPFPDVLRMLAKEAGVQLREVRPEVRDAQERLRDLHIHATSFFQSQLLAGPQGQRARDYLARREINQETIERFQLGYARDGWEHLITYLKGKGFTLEEIIQGGLAIQRETGGAYDRFRNRLIIPIRDIQGRVIAFGGRILDEGEPKYLNSPQTPIFDKSRVIFALDHARKAIRSKDQVVLVEGYMDVISAHQRGFRNVVAAMGTSITPDQVKILSRYSRNFVFALDADAAGARATQRAAELVQETLSERGVPTATSRGIRTEKRLMGNVSIAVLPEGMDPDDVLRHDPEQWRELIENAIPVVDYTIQLRASELNLETATGKSQFVQEVLPTLSKIGDPIQRRHYIGKIAGMARVRETDIEEALKQFEREQRRSSSRRRSRQSSTPAPVPPAPPPSVGPAPPATEPPPDEVIVGSSEEPPLWLDDAEAPPEAGSATATEAPPASVSPPVAPQRTLAIEPEDHLLSLILYYHQFILQWLDDELAARQIDPLFVEDFHDPMNRAVFEALEDFRLEEEDADLMDFMSERDVFIQDHFLLLWEYARNFETRKPKHIQDHHLQREVVTGLIRLRLQHNREARQQLELSIRDVSDPQEQSLLTQRFNELVVDRSRLEKAMLVYSQSAKWASNNRPTYLAAR